MELNGIKENKEIIFCFWHAKIYIYLKKKYFKI